MIIHLKSKALISWNIKILIKMTIIMISYKKKQIPEIQMFLNGITKDKKFPENNHLMTNKITEFKPLMTVTT